MLRQKDTNYRYLSPVEQLAVRGAQYQVDVAPKLSRAMSRLNPRSPIYNQLREGVEDKIATRFGIQGGGAELAALHRPYTTGAVANTYRQAQQEAALAEQSNHLGQSSLLGRVVDMIAGAGQGELGKLPDASKTTWTDIGAKGLLGYPKLNELPVAEQALVTASRNPDGTDKPTPPVAGTPSPFEPPKPVVAPGSSGIPTPPAV
jgi:hypothetical protein